MTAPLPEKEAALRKGILAFEIALSDWVLPGWPKDLRVCAFDKPAPVWPTHRFDPIQKRQYERLPDVVLVSFGAGPKPDHWDAQQTQENTVHIYADAIVYDQAFIDTMFMRGHTCRVLTFNGLLRARFEAAVLTSLSRQLHTRKQAATGDSVPQNLRQQLSETLDNVLRQDPDIAMAQDLVWGEADPAPTVWFPTQD